MTATPPTTTGKLGTSPMIIKARKTPKMGIKLRYIEALTGPIDLIPSSYHRKPKPIVKTPWINRIKTTKGSDSNSNVGPKFNPRSGNLRIPPARQE